MIYVGGLADEVDSKVLNAAFIPFGDIVEVNLPIDYETEKHRGFAFIEFELAEDASAAIDNMNDGEMFGRQLRVNLAKPMRNKEGGNRWEYFELTLLSLCQLLLGPQACVGKRRMAAEVRRCKPGRRRCRTRQAWCRDPWPETRGAKGRGSEREIQARSFRDGGRR